VDWLYSPLGYSNSLLDQEETPNSLNSFHEISIEAPNVDVDASKTIISRGNVDLDVEGLNLVRDELFGYLDFLRNSPRATLRKTKQLIDLIKKMMDDANNLHIMDYDFTLGLGAFESSLKRKKSFLIPKKRNKEEIKVADWKLI
jgi:hypothetical protein